MLNIKVAWSLKKKSCTSHEKPQNKIKKKRKSILTESTQEFLSINGLQ